MADPYLFLKEVAPPLYQTLVFRADKEELLDGVEGFVSKEGKANLRFIRGEQNLTVHSSYNPEKEAERILARYENNPHKLTVCLGVGMGYHVDAFLKAYPDRQLVILEPSYKTLRQAMKLRDFEPYFRNPRITFIITPSSNELADFLASQYNFNQHSGVQFIEPPVYARWFNDVFNAAKKRFLEHLAKFTANMATIMEADDDFIINCMNNVRHLGKFPWAAQLFGRFPGIPAIIISAGPSLHLHLEKLRELRNRAFLIAVDTAYPILLKNGINPHFVCTADPNDVNFMHLKGLDVSKTFLVVEPMTWHETLDMEGARAFICNFNGYYSSYFSKFSAFPQPLLSWGSIATTCFDLARQMACGPIIFVGQDLAYSDMLTHCPGSRYDEQYYAQVEACPNLELYTSYETFHLQRILARPVVSHVDIHGNQVLTQNNLILYAQWLEEQFSKTRQPVINATERGILRKNCHQMSFDKVCRDYLNQDRNLSEVLEAIYHEPRRFLFSDLLNDINQKIESLAHAEALAISRKKDSQDLLEAAKSNSEEEMRQMFNELSRGIHCGIEDPVLLGWLEHKNQKAEVYFQRSLGKLVGAQFSQDLILKMAELYTGYYDSRLKSFQELQHFLQIAAKGCQEGLEIQPPDALE